MKSKSLEDCCLEVENEPVAVIAAHFVEAHGSKVGKDWTEIADVEPEANPFVPENPFFTAPQMKDISEIYTNNQTDTIEEASYHLPSIRRSLSTYDVSWRFFLGVNRPAG